MNSSGVMNIPISLAAIPEDKYLHALGSVVIFAVVHWLTGNALQAFLIANGAHVIKKAYDVYAGSRDWADVFGDVLSGTAGAALAWSCLLTLAK